jgi:hypothetical protein
MGIEVRGRCSCGRTCVGVPDYAGNPMCGRCDPEPHKVPANIEIEVASRELESSKGQLSGALASFLYDLMRDHLPFGVVESLMRDATKGIATGPDTATNAWLCDYANYLAHKLKG